MNIYYKYGTIYTSKLKGDNVTDLFLVDTTKLYNDNIFYKNYNQLSEYRKFKTDKMKMRKDKNLSIGIGILLNNYLNRYGKSEKDIIYTFSKSGKPYLKNISNVFFNPSHSKNISICAFSDSEVGCDIEFIDEKTSHLNIAKRFFSAYEQNFTFSNTSLNEQLERFYRIWTLKESYLKFAGIGLGGISSIEIKFDNEIPIIYFNNKEQNIFFKEYSYNNYKISVCSKNNNFQKEIIIINI